EAGAVLSAELWDPRSEVWTTMASMQVPRIYHSTAVLLPDGRVLSGGSGFQQESGASGTNRLDAEIYSPPYLFRGARPRITSAPPAVGYGQNFTVQTPDTGITQVSWVGLSSTPQPYNRGQRFSPLSFSAIPGGLNVTAPANANLAPPGHYMLFILKNGVPSVAKIVRIG